MRKFQHIDENARAIFWIVKDQLLFIWL